MRANTQRIYELLSKGTFLSVDTIDQEAKHLYNDIEENFADYETYFLELGLRLESGDGYYYFARTREAKITIEQKLQSFAQWVDIMDFLKTYDITFSTGFQNQSQQRKDGDNKQDKQNQNGMSQDNIDQILKTMQNQENAIQQRVNAQKAQRQKANARRTGNQW